MSGKKKLQMSEMPKRFQAKGSLEKTSGISVNIPQDIYTQILFVSYFFYRCTAVTTRM
jgi:hypothetical protein